MFTPLSVPPPGLMKPPSPRLSPGRWNDGNLVRWINGYPTPVKGWERLMYPETASDIRAIHRWFDLDGLEWTAYLCDGHLYASSKEGWFDISPPNPIEPPFDDVAAGGYGMSEYDKYEYGDARPPRPRLGAIGYAFTLSNWGSNLVAMSSVDGRLLMWNPATPTVKSASVQNAPRGRTFVVTPERSVIIFGVNGDGRKFRWCDQENITNWNLADVTSKAGEYDVDPAAPIIGAVQTAAGTLFCTSIGWYIVKYVGMPYVYSYDPIYEGGIPLTAASIVPYGEGAAWLSESDFYTFDGVAVRPTVCDLKSWLSDELNPNVARFRPIGVRVDAANEIWWSFPSRDSRQNDRVAIWSFTENWWSKGMVGRTAGENSSHTASPEMALGRVVYKHESTYRYADGEMPWVETGVINARGGALMSMLRRIMVDVGDLAPPVLVSVLCRDINKRDKEFVRANMVPDAKGVVLPRISGRDFRIRVGTDPARPGKWYFGNFLVDFAPRGKRSGRT